MMQGGVSLALHDIIQPADARQAKLKAP